ncbi:MAG: hypothetical protein H8E64_05885 [Candidatus Marinimicrobia bacterium]|nr:hypothetical protein [Candidatus Neomarinimicrobiota bacterium]
MKSIIPFLFCTFLFAVSPNDSLSSPFQWSPRLLHHPPEIVFTHRPTDLELFVEIPLDSIESVSLFLKTDAINTAREIPLQFSKERYAYRFDPTVCQCTFIQYFFVVRLSDYSILSVPVNDQKEPEPVERPLINPQEYYQQKWDQNR